MYFKRRISEMLRPNIGLKVFPKQGRLAFAVTTSVGMDNNMERFFYKMFKKSGNQKPRIKTGGGLGGNKSRACPTTRKLSPTKVRKVNILSNPIVYLLRVTSVTPLPLRCRRPARFPLPFARCRYSERRRQWRRLPRRSPLPRQSDALISAA